MSVRIINGDCIEELRKLPATSVHCCVTSPPYWGLRDYGIPPSIWGGDLECLHQWGDWQESHDEREQATAGKTRTTDRFYGDESRRFDGNHQKHTAGAFCRCGAWRGAFGLEPTPALYVEHAVMVFREVHRVLRDDATLWINLGDSYSNDTKWGGSSGGKNQHSADGGYQGQRVRRNGDCDPKRGPAAPGQPFQQFPSGLKPKDLCEIHSDVVRALRADGWWLRSRIPWLKRNAMPESTKDRPTTAVEYVFLLSKSGDTQLHRARDTLEWSHDPDLTQRLPRPTKEDSSATVGRWAGFDYYYDGEAVKIKSAVDTNARYARGRSDEHKWADGGPGNQTIAKSFDHMQKPVSGWDNGPGDHRGKVGRYPKNGKAYSFARETATEGKPGAPDQHRTDREDVDYVGQRARRNSDWFFESWQGMLQDEAGYPLALIVNPQPFKEAHFATFPPSLIEPCILAGCPVGGTVIDPFGGAGTTGLVSDRLQRNAILIELNSEYATMAEKRIHQDGPLFSSVTA